MESLDEAIQSVTSHVMLTGTKAVRVSGGDDTTVEQEDRREVKNRSEEFQLRGLRRTVAEQVVRVVRQIRDCRPKNMKPRTGSEHQRLEKLLTELETAVPETLWRETTPIVAKLRTMKIPSDLHNTEEGSLIAEIQTNLDTVISMTKVLAHPQKIKDAGGVKALFPELQKDFSDVTAPHIDSYNRALKEGLSELLHELRAGTDIEAVQAVPRFFILTLDNVTDKRQETNNGPLLSEKKFKDPEAWETAGNGVIDRVQKVLMHPPENMSVNWKRTTITKYSWIISLEKKGKVHGAAHDEDWKQMSRKKRLQKLLQQKPVEEREAGGVRRLLESLKEALHKDATPKLKKVYAKGEIQNLQVGWDGEKGPTATPCGRAAVQRLFRGWCTEFIALSEPGTRNSKRNAVKPYQEWLEESATPKYGKDGEDLMGTAKRRKTTAKKTKKASSQQGTPPSEPAAEPTPEPTSPVIKPQSFQDEEGESSDEGLLVDSGRGLGKSVISSCGGGKSRNDRRSMRNIHPRYRMKRLSSKRLRSLKSSKALLRRSVLHKKPVFPSAVRDPGYPPGGLRGLQDLWKILTETPGSPLHPQGHRLQKSNYTAPLMIQVAFSYTAGFRMPLFVADDWVYAGEVPVMVRSDACMLKGKTTGELASIYREEQREPGGYFIMKGNERVLRMVLVARGNHPITLERASFSNKGPSFTSKCVFIRSVKQSGIAVPNYLYMLSSGKIILSFSRGSTWQIPLSLVLLALSDELTPLQIAEKMSHDAESNKWLAAFMGDVFNQVQLARAYVGIEKDSKKGFPSCSEHWQYILGKYLCTHKKMWVRELLVRCRARLDAGAYDTEVYRMVGMWALREHVLPHLNTSDVPFEDAKVERRAKLDTLITMVTKLVMFQSGRLREEGEDGLVNQELISPGQLWLHAVMDGVLAVGRGLRSALSMLGLTDNKPREGWETLRPPRVEDFVELSAGKGEAKLRDLIWSYFWQKRRSDKRNHEGEEEWDSGLVSTAKLVKAPEEAAESWKMRYEKPDTDERARGNRQRVLTEPTYPVCFLVSTGNYTQEPMLSNGASLPQSAGWSVVVERINQFRFLEQFRATHRGKTIQEMRTTLPRRYQMDGWGFLCIVHTPDGGPCGVMNHLTFPTKVAIGMSTAQRRKTKSTCLKLMKSLGTALFVQGVSMTGEAGWCPVMIDGELIGFVHATFFSSDKRDILREARCMEKISSDVEIVSVDPEWVTSETGLTGVTNDKGSKTAPKMYSGMYIFTGPGRLCRPIKKLGVSRFTKGAVSWVGTQEQIFMDIAALHKDIGEARQDLGSAFKYVEMYTTTALSLTASLIPYFEMNCSPRNLFQCGMAKQTMGSCFHSLSCRNDNKLYQTHACQAALLRTDNQHIYQMDDYPNGINVILAVAAYTGFDMEDALLINKSSVERGLFQGSVYLSAILEPFPEATGGKRRRSPTYVKIPTEGMYLEKGNAYAETSEGKKEIWSKAEACRVHSVEILEEDTEEKAPTRIRVIFRIERTPVVGDKFAARHGQKGTLPMLIPQYDMPFTDDGVVPDVIINPHAFPSRMTVGMLIEMVASKYAAIKGTFPDATAWSEISDKPIHATKMGDMLGQLGYSRTGAQMLTHSSTGEKMQCDIYQGICYYQRLRHMVSDKYQARERADRATAGVDPLTGQPVKGRKKGGGIRVGEMERDAIIAHGTVQVGQDRLLKSSDLGVTRTCNVCGSTPCTCEDGGNEQFRFAPKALEFMNAQLRTMGVTLRTVAN